MIRFILASGSPRRKQLLEQLGVFADVIPSGVSEQIEETLPPGKLVEQLAHRKAAHVYAENQPADAMILGADTVVVLDDHILGQPEDQDDATRMLKSLSGRSHYVYTGVSLIRTDSDSNISVGKTFHERTLVHIAQLSGSEIRSYVESGSPLDKAGGYGIQDDWGALFVSGIEGDYYTVVGLPLHKLYQEMKGLAPDVADMFRPEAVTE